MGCVFTGPDAPGGPRLSGCLPAVGGVARRNMQAQGIPATCRRRATPSAASTYSNNMLGLLSTNSHSA
jgi:hypothetical protein